MQEYFAEVSLPIRELVEFVLASGSIDNRSISLHHYFLQFSRYRHFTNLNIIIFQYHCTDIHQ